MYVRDVGEEGGWLEGEHCGVLSAGVLNACGRDTRNGNGEQLLAFASKHDLALVNTLFSAPKIRTSHSFNRPANRKRIDYILSRQIDRKLVRNAVMHP